MTGRYFDHWAAMYARTHTYTCLLATAPEHMDRLEQHSPTHSATELEQALTIITNHFTFSPFYKSALSKCVDFVYSRYCLRNMQTPCRPQRIPDDLYGLSISYSLRML